MFIYGVTKTNKVSMVPSCCRHFTRLCKHSVCTYLSKKRALEFTLRSRQTPASREPLTFVLYSLRMSDFNTQHVYNTRPLLAHRL